MSNLIADFSFDKPDGRTLKRLGFIGVVGYVSGERGKDWSKAQVDGYRAAGLGTGFVAEGTGREALSTAALVAETKRGDSIMNAYGVPKTVPLFTAVDFQPSGAQIREIAHTVWAARMSVVRPLGVYGNYDLLRYLFDNHIVQWGWQTYAWSGGRLDPRAQYYQYSNGHRVAGGTVDYDRQEHGGGLWMPDSPHPQPGKPPYPGHPFIYVPSLKLVYSPSVKEWQAQMTKDGYPLVADGFYGPASYAAAKAFQLKEHLVVDGIVGPVTWAKTWDA